MTGALSGNYSIALTAKATDPITISGTQTHQLKKLAETPGAALKIVTLQLWEAAPMSEVATIVTEISAGIVAIVGALRMQLPTTHIVLLGILPRGNLLTGGPSADENDYMLPSM